MELIKKKRAGLRRILTILTNKIDSTLPELNKEDLLYYKGKLESIEQELKGLNSSILDTLEEEEYCLEQDHIEQIDENLKRSQIRIEETLSDIGRINTAPPTQITTKPPTTELNISRLPKLQLAHFDGSLENWQGFWEQFKVSIDNNPTIPTIDKHIYLRGLLTGRAETFVKGIQISENTYELTKDRLIKNFGDTELIIQNHIDRLMEMEEIGDHDLDQLENTFIECQKHLDALKALEEDTSTYGRILSKHILRIFPSSLCTKWLLYATEKGYSQSNLQELMKYLEIQIRCTLSSQRIKSKLFSENEKLYTTSALHINKNKREAKQMCNATTKICVFCNKREHWGQDCDTVIGSIKRKELLVKKGHCFLCLRKGHMQKNCPKGNWLKCTNCNQKHHLAICEQNDEVSVNKIELKDQQTFLQTAKVWIKGKGGKRKLVRVLLDNCSEGSFIHSDLSQELGLQAVGCETLTIHGFEACNPPEVRRLVQFEIQSTYGPQSLAITAIESQHTYSPQIELSTEIIGFNRKLNFADAKLNENLLPIQILIGADYYWEIVHHDKSIRLTDKLVLQNSKFGWLMNGHQADKNKKSCNHITTFHNSVSDTDVKSFWNLEAIGINEEFPRKSKLENEVLEEFENSFFVTDGRAVVKLPWKKNQYLTDDNFEVANQRFKYLRKYLRQNKELHNEYDNVMKNYFQNGYIERIDSDITNNHGRRYYLPHQAVIKNDRETTKVRIVFDASSHKQGKLSLNDVLESGPNLNPDVTAVLLRFRLNKYAVTCDGKQAFLQIVLNEEDRDATRFIWKEIQDIDTEENTNSGFADDKITIYRFTRLPFGLTCSPFLLAGSVRKNSKIHAKKYPKLIKLIEKGMYVDDFTSGSDTEASITEIFEQLTDLMGKIQLEMTKWTTNSNVLKKTWKTLNMEIRSKSTVLGMKWLTEEDVLFIQKKQEQINNITKRNILIETARIFDPLGFITPVTVIGKIIFQETWIKGITWDEVVPSEISEKWELWRNDLKNLNTIKVPRWLGIFSSSQQWRNIHIFCDASEQAYGAVMYLRINSNKEWKSKLVISKCRLAPVKKITLPRLELLAALMGSRLLMYFIEETELQIDQINMWSDSTVVLSWIKGDPSSWKMFVQNRVLEINRYTTPSQWNYCSTKENPADYLTRGMKIEKLNSSQWFEGPKWLKLPEKKWPEIKRQFKEEPEANYEKRKILRKDILIITKQVELFLCNKYSKLTKLLRVTAWIIRFTSNCRKQFNESVSNELTAAEIFQAKKLWITYAQKFSFEQELIALQKKSPIASSSRIKPYNPFLDEDGIIRLGGRIQNAQISEDEKHPIIMPNDHHFTYLTIMDAHIKLHHLGLRIVLSELRTTYWIIRGRQTIKRVLRTCLQCAKYRAQPAAQIEGPLPLDRVRHCKPFEVSGIDFAGPVFIRTRSYVTKAYITLFTCATTRAIHIELVSEMTTNHFLMAFQRFIGRRGVPHTVYTDNATTFKGANKALKDLWNLHNESELLQYFAHCGISWKFIPVGAPWWGGWWERMVGTVKRCLIKTIGNCQLTGDELHTVLVGIEACINSRPITHDYDKIEDNQETLTPAHFLIGERLSKIPINHENKHQEVKLTRLWYHKQLMIDHYWKRWKKEYLLDLRNFHEVKQHKIYQDLKEGDIVLLKDDYKKRHLWEISKILKIIPGRDGLGRLVQIKTKDGKIITKPVQLICPLEIS